MDGENKPLSRFPPEYDAKWRFFWPIGERPEEIKNDIPKVYPKNFPDWEQKMDKWGNMMIEACKTAAEMAAIGMGLDKDTFSSRMEKGHHLLAPTGSDLKKYDVGTPFAGFHYDLNFLTIHGKSRYPGLFVWLRNWKKMVAKVPEGCLLLQAGAMFEHITGGFVHAGYHEVFYTEATKAVLEKTEQLIAEGKDRKTWRVSSTLFSQLRYDVDLSPLPELKDKIPAEAYTKYVKMTAHDKLIEELRAINLAPKQSYASKENPEENTEPLKEEQTV